MFPCNGFEPRFYIACRRGVIEGQMGETDMNLCYFSRLFSVVRRHTHIHTHQSSWLVCVITGDGCVLSRASRSADLSVSDLAGRRIYGPHLVMAADAACVCVYVCKYTSDQPNHQPAATISPLRTCGCSCRENRIWCKRKSPLMKVYLITVYVVTCNKVTEV